MQKKFTKIISDLNVFRKQLTAYLKNYDTFCLIDSLGVESPLVSQDYELICGMGVKKIYRDEEGNQLDIFDSIESAKGFKFGYMAYESGKAKFNYEAKKSPVPSQASVFWFEPKMVLYILKGTNELCVEGDFTNEFISKFFQNSDLEKGSIHQEDFSPHITKEAYLQQIETIKSDIEEGDYYEMNYCMEFATNHFKSCPFAIWNAVIEKQTVPFAAFFRNKDFFAICASPERFLKKVDKHIFSQPIKGTRKRESNPIDDQKAKTELLNSEKERAENVMIVDLVRNDLSRICQTGTVQVQELFGVYSYPLVHQMISTIKGRLEDKISLKNILDSTFPMGSMTGAPKKMVVERAALYEKTKRGIYSGSIGYIDPENNFDLNVVIRTLIVDQKENTASYHVGGAITFDSNPEEEYEECLNKAAFWKGLFDAK